MSTTINRLPDEILAKILNRLSLQELAPLDLVSHRWKSVQEYVLARIISLTLYKQEFAWNHNDFYQLMFFEPLSPRYGKNSLFDPSPEPVYELNETDDAKLRLINIVEREWLVRKLPNITKLSIWGTYFTQYDFQYLFDQWSALEQLNISQGDGMHIDSWWTQINRLSSLKHLGLFSYDNHNSFEQLQLLPQLVTFCLDCYIPINVLNDIFTKLGPNIRNLFLNGFVCTPQALDSIENCIQKNEALAVTLSTKVTRLTMEAFEVAINFRALNFIVKNFGSLTHLDLCVRENLYLNEIICPLSQLNRLTSLRLSTLSFEMDCPNMLEANNPLQSILSLKTLHLSNLPCDEKVINYKSPAPTTYFYRYHLPDAFPQISELRLENSLQMYECKNCYSNDRLFLSKYFMEDRIFDGGLLCSCSKALWDAFRQMNLRAVYRNTNLVYDHTSDCFEQFVSRLERYGQTPHNRRPKF